MVYRKTVITFYFINRKHICDNAVISPIRLQSNEDSKISGFLQILCLWDDLNLILYLSYVLRKPILDLFHFSYLVIFI